MRALFCTLGVAKSGHLPPDIIGRLLKWPVSCFQKKKVPKCPSTHRAHTGRRNVFFFSYFFDQRGCLLGFNVEKKQKKRPSCAVTQSSLPNPLTSHRGSVYGSLLKTKTPSNYKNSHIFENITFDTVGICYRTFPPTLFGPRLGPMRAEGGGK